MADLLAQAEALSSRLFGADPAREAAIVEDDYRVLATPPAPESEPLDPAANAPITVTTAAIHELLATSVPGVAAELGDGGVAGATAVISALPRDLTLLLDEEGAFSQPDTWRLLAELECSNPGMADVGHAAPEVGMDALAAHAREHGLGADLQTLDAVSILINSLPPRVRAGISPSMAADPSLYALAAHLGGKLWAFAPKPRHP